MPKQYSLILVDDHVVMRNGLKEIIELMGDYKIVDQFSNGKELIERIPFKNDPDLILLDLTMPVLDGLHTLQWMNANDCLIPVLILTVNAPDSQIIELYRNGARGYLEKNCSAPELKKAMENIFDTGYHHNDLLSKALRDWDRKPKDERNRILKEITSRELDFIRLVCSPEEYTYEQMADLLSVSRRTIDGYRESLFFKFDIKSKTGLAIFAIKHNLLQSL